MCLLIILFFPDEADCLMIFSLTAFHPGSIAMLDMSFSSIQSRITPGFTGEYEDIFMNAAIVRICVIDLDLLMAIDSMRSDYSMLGFIAIFPCLG